MAEEEQRKRCIHAAGQKLAVRDPGGPEVALVVKEWATLVNSVWEYAMKVVLRQRYCILVVGNTRVEIVVKDLLTQKNQWTLIQSRAWELERLVDLM